MAYLPNKQSMENLRLLMLHDRAARLRIVCESHFLFFHFYFSHYVRSATAAFQKEMFALTERLDWKTLVITAFRGSGKSTIMNLSFILWAILGSPRKKFILVVGQTQAQARQHLKNVKTELEDNALLGADLGPFREEEDEWRNSCLIISNHNAKIMAVSVDQAVRGLRHGAFRPDLIICDDIEDQPSAKTKEGRDKTYNWVKGELLPAGDTQTQIVLIGNLVHEDCLPKRLEREIKSGTLQGIYREYPLLTEDGLCLWPGKYRTSADIETEKRRIGSEAAWQREYLLKIISDSERLIHPSWIQIVERLPEPTNDFPLRMTATGIDLAISKSEYADFTAMVSISLFGTGDERQFYVLPHPVNEKLTALETLERAKQVSLAVGNGEKTKLYIEDVGYQSSLVEHLRHDHFPAEGVPTHGQDKRARLALVSHLVQQGKVFFASAGTQELITQLTGFGSENHDDLADAFAIVMLKLMEVRGGGFFYATIGGDDDDDDGGHWWGDRALGRIPRDNILNMQF